MKSIHTKILAGLFVISSLVAGDTISPEQLDKKDSQTLEREKAEKEKFDRDLQKEKSEKLEGIKVGESTHVTGGFKNGGGYVEVKTTFDGPKSEPEKKEKPQVGNPPASPANKSAPARNPAPARNSNGDRGNQGDRSRGREVNGNDRAMERAHRTG